MQRRTFITGAGTSIPIGLAGCISWPQQEVALDYVNIRNSVDEPIEIDIRIEWDGEVTVEETAEIGDTSLHLTEEWPDERGTWEVSGRIRGEDWTSISSEDAEEEVVGARGFIEDRVALDLAWALMGTE